MARKNSTRNWTLEGLSKNPVGRNQDFNECEPISAVIGIDPGKNTGFAVWDKQQQQITVLQTLDFWQAYAAVQAYPADTTLIKIEVPDTIKVWSENKSVSSMSKMATASKVATNVGGVIMQAELLADGCKRLGYRVEKVHPKGKVDADYFKRVTGYVGRTNEHSRDAGMLAFSG